MKKFATLILLLACAAVGLSLIGCSSPTGGTAQTLPTSRSDTR